MSSLRPSPENIMVSILREAFRSLTFKNQFEGLILVLDFQFGADKRVFQTVRVLLQQIVGDVSSVLHVRQLYEDFLLVFYVVLFKIEQIVDNTRHNSKILKTIKVIWD